MVRRIETLAPCISRQTSRFLSVVMPCASPRLVSGLAEAFGLHGLLSRPGLCTFENRRRYEQIGILNLLDLGSDDPTSTIR